jgi:hypothetical protein
MRLRIQRQTNFSNGIIDCISGTKGPTKNSELELVVMGALPACCVRRIRYLSDEPVMSPVPPQLLGAQR